MTAEERARMHSGPAQGRERWVINKLRALNSWYTKGLEDGSHLRISINSATSIAQLRDLIAAFFFSSPDSVSFGGREVRPTTVHLPSAEASSVR